MKLIQILESINTGCNLIFYDRNVSLCYDELNEGNLCIFFDEPVPIRIRLVKILKMVSPDYKFNKAHITIAELKVVIIKELKAKNLIILFNNFEKLNKSSLSVYEYFNGNKNIQFICSFKTRFKKVAYKFYKTFKFVNKEDYHPNEDHNQINITYTVYGILSIFCFLIYIKTSTSIYIATIMMGAAWFGLIIFRTLMYAGGRV